MLKRTFSCFASLSLILTLICGIAASGLAADGREIQVVEAAKLALEKNLEVKIAALNLENSKIDYQKSQANNLLTESRYMQMQSELSLAQAQDVYLQTRNNVIINTIKDYYQALLLQLDQMIKKNQIALEKRLLAETRSQVDSGHLGQLDLLKQESRHETAIFNLEKAQADQQQLMRKIKANLGLESTQEVHFTSITVQRLHLTEEEAYQQALSHSFTLQLKKGRWDLAKVDLERANAKATPELELAKLNNNLEIAELEYKQTKEEIQQSIQNQYFLFQQSRDRLQLTKQTCDQAYENYQIIKKQKEAGLKTENDLLTAQLNSLQEDYNQQTAWMNYLINQLQLQKLMGIEIEVNIGEICK